MPVATRMTDFLPPGGIPELFYRRAEARADRPFLHRWAGEGWTAWTWRETAARVSALARDLARRGVGRGDRVALVSENRVEWQVSALAIMTTGAMHVPLSTSGTPDEWRQILASATPCGAIVSGAQRAKYDAAAAAAGRSGWRLDLDDPGPEGWPARAATAGSAPPLASALDDVCCLIFTSGTGGAPKGVEQTHRNILANAMGAADNLSAYGIGDERFLSFLPLSHTYEHTAGFITPVALGAEIFVSRGPEHFARELRTAAPTVLIVVPRFCEVMQQRIAAGLARQSALKRRLFAVTERIGRRQAAGTAAGPGARLWMGTIGARVKRQLRDHFGGAVKCMLSAGAPLRADTSLFFNGLGLPLHEGYGQTEAAPGITMQRRGMIRPGTVGTPMTGMELRLADDGEILARGPNVMRGYWQDPATTAATLADGWLHTGDIGRLEPDGSLVIVDRKKDFLKTAGGDMIAPQPLELALTAQPGIGQAMVVGDNWPHLAVLIVPDTPIREAAAAGRLTAADVTAQAQAAVDAVNRTLPAKRRLRRLAVVLQPFTVENGQLTGTLKVRRRRVLEAHATVIAGLREGG